jgi:predicted house-cleaning noncanonical NTP pyrophosphatase (MazG superfamily)
VVEVEVEVQEVVDSKVQEDLFQVDLVDHLIEVLGATEEATVLPVYLVFFHGGDN